MCLVPEVDSAGGEDADDEAAVYFRGDAADRLVLRGGGPEGGSECVLEGAPPRQRQRQSQPPHHPTRLGGIRHQGLVTHPYNGSFPNTPSSHVQLSKYVPNIVKYVERYFAIV